MRAARLHAFGGPDVVRVEDVPTPTPGAGELLVRVRACGLNFADTERRRGLYLRERPLPDTLGFEAAGVVEALGPGVEPSWLGRRVAVLSKGAHAELVVAPVGEALRLPDALDDVTGAAFPLQGLTAWHTLFTAGRVRAGEVVVLSAAAGGVGLFATQLAVLAGATVLGLVSSPARAAAVRAAGATAVLVRDETLEARVLEATGGRGADVLLDSLGRALAPVAPRLLAPFGRWVVFGESTGAPPPLDLAVLFPRSLTVTSWWLRTPHPGDTWRRGVEAVTEALLDGSVRLPVTRWKGLDALADAHRALESRATVGKHVVVL